MSKRSLVRLGVFFLLALIGLGVFFLTQRKMTEFYIILAVVVGVVIAVVAVFAAVLGKDGFFKDVSRDVARRKKFNAMKRQMEQAEAMEARIEKKYEGRIEKLEAQMDAINDYVDKHGPFMTKEQLEAKAAEFEALEKQIEALEEEQNQEYSKVFEKIKNITKEDKGE